MTTLADLPYTDGPDAVHPASITASPAPGADPLSHLLSSLDAYRGLHTPAIAPRDDPPLCPALRPPTANCP